MKKNANGSGGDDRTKTKVVTTYLEMRSASDLRAAPERALTIVESKIPLPEFSRFLYSAVGGEWYWIERLEWSYSDWRAYLDRNELRTWVAYSQGSPAGYFELESQTGGNVEIRYFGLLPSFIGKGFGGHLLTCAIREAWGMGASRVWVHTNSLDGPHALRNYMSRGFRVYDEQTTYELLPDKPPGPWPGAGKVCTDRTG
jgi:GNAT superfamily N-acetyltransferase